ncbi:MAG: hypothetical protein K9N05_01210 [Candidatus Marinimicrobia bacterium]|nr:hypothetical protein [Candidatus Neomarinimicrobiota bacterium]
MKKKYTKILLLILSILLLFSACTEPEEIENPLIGTWKYMNYQTGDWEKITFREDLTYRLENYNGTSYESVVITGNYHFDEEKYVFERRGLDDIGFFYEISGNNLIVTYGKTYVRQ